MIETGIVHAINKKNIATVRFDRKMACENCNMCLKPKDKMFVELDLENTLNAKVGDYVSVTIPDNIVLTASFLVYLVPAIVLLATLFLTRNLKDYISFSIAIVAMIISYIGISLVDKIMKKKKGLLPTMKAIINMEVKKDE